MALVKVADEIRRRVVGDRITYVVNRNLNFTNVCIVGCAFCGFSRGPDSPDAYFHSTETLVAKSVEAVERGATEVCIQGGLPKDLDGYYYVELLRAIKARLPELHVHAYSPMEITYGVEKTRLPLRDYLADVERSGPEQYSGNGGGDSRRRGPPVLESQQAEGAAVDRGDPHGARSWHSFDVHDDVRPYRESGALGEASSAAARNSKRNAWVYGIRSAGIYPFADPAFSTAAPLARVVRFTRI